MCRQKRPHTGGREWGAAIPGGRSACSTRWSTSHVLETLIDHALAAWTAKGDGPIRVPGLAPPLPDSAKLTLVPALAQLAPPPDGGGITHILLVDLAREKDTSERARKTGENDRDRGRHRAQALIIQGLIIGILRKNIVLAERKNDERRRRKKRR